MFDSSSYDNPTPLAHANASRDVLPMGGTSHNKQHPIEIDSRLNNAFKLCNFIWKIMVDFHKRILFSDEAHFWLNGYVNKQNCRIWSEANPQVYVETPLHPEKLTVWCALWAGGILLQKR
ncbi:hypothetical protein TNCV_942151 [Trichonephila clavipes]|nr:hypothetical protein TNCV_942151 [Trichonephila clavipes]